MQVKKCLYCGKEFKDKSDNHTGLYCSINCGKKYRRKLISPIVEKICPNCNELFLSSNNNKIFCSNECNLENWSKYLKTDEMRNRARDYAISQKGKYLNIQGGARARDYEFKLSFKEYVDNFWEKPCYYCGGITQNGIDRINNKIGYKIKNCVPACLCCNRMKQTLSLSDFLSHIQKIINNTVGAKPAGSIK